MTYMHSRLVFLLFSVSLILSACSLPNSFLGPKPTPVANDETKAVLAAKVLFDQKYGALKEASRASVLADGPCLMNQIIPDWVADIAHQPRVPQDDDPKNQCQDFQTSKAHHFIELDEQGNYLRAF